MTVSDRATAESTLLAIEVMTGLRIRRIYEPPPTPESWSGPFPFVGGTTSPPRHQCVVYYLFDPEGELCYVGSTAHLRGRLRAHAAAGKVFVSWIAEPYNFRWEAYRAEEAMLQAYMPYLNRKCGR